MPNIAVTGSITVFNRYGQVIFASKGYPQPWDGRKNNKNVPIGTYYYVIIPNENEKAVSGYVTIVR